MVTTVNLVRRRHWHPTPVLLPGKSHGGRSLVGCSPWGRYESDSTERLHFHFSLSCIGEGNGNPLQCSCLENPWDGGAWWVNLVTICHHTKLLQYYWLYSLCCILHPFDIYFMTGSLYLLISFTYLSVPPGPLSL